MPEFVRSKLIVIFAAAGLLGGIVAAAALAAPDSPPGPGPAGLDGTETATATATETVEATDTPEATETPEEADTEGEHDDGLGVPLDSPACAGDEEHPNPHDTDGDFDGCREVEGKNLPDPAADAQSGTPGPGHIGDLHRPEHSLTPGPPEGDPPFGNAFGEPTPTATPTPTG
jgi:hypothetical protein